MRQIFPSSAGWYHYLLDHRKMLIYRDNDLHMFVCVFVYLFICLFGLLLSVVKVFELNMIP